MFEYKKIYVAVDDSKESHYAFEKALAVAKRNPGASVTAIHVIDNGYRMNFEDMATKSVFIDANSLPKPPAYNYENKAATYGVAFEMKTIEGSPKSTLLKQFKNLGPECLVICGTSSLGRIEKMIFGSVSKSIVSQSGCDVLVVRTPELFPD